MGNKSGGGGRGGRAGSIKVGERVAPLDRNGKPRVEFTFRVTRTDRKNVYGVVEGARPGTFAYGVEFGEPKSRVGRVPS